MKKYPKLRGRIVERFGTMKRFAEALGKSEQTVIYKLNGKYGFSQDDIVVWSNLLEIEKEEVGIYFFGDKL